MQEMQVQSLGREDPLEKEGYPPLQCSCLDGQRSLAGYTVHGVARAGHDFTTKLPLTR